MSPRLSDKRFQAKMTEQAEAAKPKAYIPPHLRGKANAAPSKIMARTNVTGPRKLDGKATPKQAAMTAEQKAAKKAEKNKKRRERAKAAKEEEARRAETEAAAKQAAEEKALAEKRANMSPEEARAKDIKKLQKKLKGVEKIKAMQASGQTPDQAQKDKLATEASLRAELAKLGV
jgi:uncharacterized protein with WD repeat